MKWGDHIGLGTGASDHGQTAMLSAPEWAPYKFYLMSKRCLVPQKTEGNKFFLPIALFQVATLLQEVARVKFLWVGEFFVIIQHRGQKCKYGCVLKCVMKSWSWKKCCNSVHRWGSLGPHKSRGISNQIDKAIGMDKFNAICLMAVILLK